MESAEDKVSVCAGSPPPTRGLKTVFDGKRQVICALISLAVFIAIWKLAAMKYNSILLLPPPERTLLRFLAVVHDPGVLKDLVLTLERVLIGFSFALGIGVPLGFIMGYSKTASQLLDPLVGTIRQVPIMAWIPLTIVWFGLGDGPTVFLIAMVGIFPLILNTIAGVQGISQDYYNAARSMGAGPWSIFAHVVFPGSLPDILTGARLALGSGWMSVICAEFIATSSGFGFAMVDAQTRMETDKLLALMIMGAIVGYCLDRFIAGINQRFGQWRLGQR